jgi:hypothetical protein
MAKAQFCEPVSVANNWHNFLTRSASDVDPVADPHPHPHQINIRISFRTCIFKKSQKLALLASGGHR